MNKTNKILTVVVVALVLILGVYLVSKKVNAPGTGDTGGVDLGSGTIEFDTEEGTGKAPVLNADEIAKIPKPTITTPVVSASLTAEVRAVLTQNFNDAKSIVEKNPFSFDTWNRLGVLYKIAGDYKKASEMWEYVTKANPSDIASFSNLGDLYSRYLKDYVRAEIYLKRAITNDPSFIAGYSNLADFYRYFFQTNTTKAVDTLKLGIAKNPGAIDLYVALAGYYKEKGDNGNARSYYTQALTLAQKTNGSQALVNSLNQELANLK